MIGAIGSSSYMNQNFFSKIDSNKDNQIDKSEFAEMTKNRPSKTNQSSDENADDLFSKIDTDQDGAISENENDTFLKSMQDATQKVMAGFAELSRLSQANGTNQSSLITDTTSSDTNNRQTISSLLSSLTTEDTEFTNDLFAKIDTNQDDSISEDEYEAFSQKMQEGAQNGTGGGPGMPPPPGGMPPGGGMQGMSPSTTTEDEETEDTVFSEMDTNEDGTVSQAEYQAYFDKIKEEAQNNMGGPGMPPPPGGMPPGSMPGMNQTTASTDSVASDTSSASDISSLLDSLTTQNEDDIFSKLDTNQDGTISKDEYEAYSNKMQEDQQKVMADRLKQQDFYTKVEQYLKSYTSTDETTASNLSLEI